MDRHERKIAMAVAKPPDLRAKDILIAPETDHTNETQNEHRSPYELYQMTLPHIIDSNARVHRLVAIQKKKQRKFYLERLRKHLGIIGIDVDFSNIQAEVESKGSAFERYEERKKEKFKTKLLKDIQSSVKTRVCLKKIRSEYEKSAVGPVECKEASIKKKKGSNDKSDDKNKSIKKSKISIKDLPLSETFVSLSQTTGINQIVQAEEEVNIATKLIGMPEDASRDLLWRHIARKQIPKITRAIHQGTAARIFNAKKLAQAAAGLIKRQNSRLAGKPVAAARRSMKEMLGFWKRNEREERELRKRAEKEAAEKRRLEEEKREARRQAKKLNFLITQTELYSHFVGRKQQTPISTVPALSKDMDFADVDDSVIHAEAERIAKNAAAAHQAKLEQFQTSTEIVKEKEKEESDMDFMNPSTLKDATILEQPTLMQVSLKSYQLKGLTWLASLYEQGINGILADEMGLGKTIQSISLLAHLAERQNNWGPFLIVTPASTLHNWQQEFARFVPALRIIPYWGSVQDRKVLRSTCMTYWTGKKPVTRDTPFHVMITSYQLIVSDEVYLQKVKWQYMILDEAQAIKSSSSIRWKTLLGFKCRNRLLLTGTPIQNSMQELWALLHFIMPTLFDSHDEFSEWFSKDIENHAENRGSGLNSHQLHRLHMILKPFMLRRVKSDVENEMGAKVEVDVICELSPRQKRLYRGIKDKLPILDLLIGGGGAANKFNFGFGIGGGTGGGQSAALDTALMNLVMQFRKVCNHPELLERTEIVSPLTFTTPDRLLSRNLMNTERIIYTSPAAIELRFSKRIIEEIPLGKKRILLEVSNDFESNNNFNYAKKLSICEENEKKNEIYCKIPALDTFKFVEERLPMAAPLKVISKGPFIFPSSQADDLNSLTSSVEISSSSLDKSVTIPSMEKFIRDCGKLSKLDSMLLELKADGHRVLIYNQMTKMIDLLEEYLQYRGYSYLRLDGSTNISTRRDLVNSWQTDSSIFVFLLSTRAGGLGINLTAADTVIFYDSDWNPTVDQQAMDRAHRLGQLKQVTVYRMITRNSIEERIMQRAKQKDKIHKVVISGGTFKDHSGAEIESFEGFDGGKPKDRKEIMSLLLVDEE